MDPSDRKDPGVPFSATILAGGGSRRFGSPKALAQVDGVPLLHRVLGALREAGAHPVRVVLGADPAISATTSPTRHPLHATDLPPGVPILRDRRAGLGPLAGIEAALMAAAGAGEPGTLVVACDLPHLPPPLLRALALKGMQREGDRVVLPWSPARAGFEPLVGWYPVGILRVLETRLVQGPGGVIRFLEGVGREILPEDSVRRWAPDPDRAFQNVNHR